MATRNIFIKVQSRNRLCKVNKLLQYEASRNTYTSTLKITVNFKESKRKKTLLLSFSDFVVLGL